MNQRRPTSSEPIRAIESFQPEGGESYSIEAVSHLTGVSRRTILLYCRHGLLQPIGDPDLEGYFFDDRAILLVRRMEDLKCRHGINLRGIRIIMRLWAELDRLHGELGFLRRR